MGCKNALSGNLLKKSLTFDDETFSARAIANKWKWTPGIILNYLILQNKYKMKKSPYSPLKQENDNCVKKCLLKSAAALIH